MKLKYWGASAALIGCVTVTGVAVTGSLARDSAPAAQMDAHSLRLFERLQDSAPVVGAPILAATAPATALPPPSEPPFATWSRVIASGETLDAVLAEAGLAAPDRAEVSLALGAEFDLRRLQPGHKVTVTTTTVGTPYRVTLGVDDGVIIEAVFGERVATRIITPDAEIVPFAREAVIETSLFAALERAKIPVRFAVDLAQMLGSTVDFQRDLIGGETLRLLWREARVGDEMVGQPEIAFAALDLGDTLYEIVWPDDGSGRATIYVDGEVLRVFAQPVVGARLSSVFGSRRHPVYGNVRMHTGVDFAAARGTPVHATAPGRVSFIGWRSGYGRVVEIAHGAETMTRYAHLSAVPKDLAKGQRVAAGDAIGQVGTTGTATGPNLHYEVLVNGRPTDPLSNENFAQVVERAAKDRAALKRLSSARAKLQDHLGIDLASETTERL